MDAVDLSIEETYLATVNIISKKRMGIFTKRNKLKPLFALVDGRYEEFLARGCLALEEDVFEYRVIKIIINKLCLVRAIAKSKKHKGFVRRR